MCFSRNACMDIFSRRLPAGLDLNAWFWLGGHFGIFYFFLFFVSFCVRSSVVAEAPFSMGERGIVDGEN